MNTYVYIVYDGETWPCNTAEQREQAAIVVGPGRTSPVYEVPFADFWEAEENGFAGARRTSAPIVGK